MRQPTPYATTSNYGPNQRRVRMTKHNINPNLHTVRIGFGTKFTEDQMAYFRHFARAVLTPEKPSIGNVYVMMRADMFHREIEGQETFALCSERTFRRIVHSMRNNTPNAPQAASNAVVPDGVPTNILVMDWCKFDLPRQCTLLGFWERLHNDVRSRLFSIRSAYAAVAMDPCSLALCGFRMTAGAPTSSDAVATLAMAVRNNVETSIQCFGRPDFVHIDGSAAYYSHAFLTTVKALTGKEAVTDKQHPGLSSRVERALHSLAKSRTQDFDIGESVLFSDQWDPAKFAMVTDQDILDLVAQLIVTCYHGTPRHWVAGLTPMEHWNSLLANGRALSPVLSKAEYRDLFGVNLKRRIGNKGVKMLGIQYASPELALVHAWHYKAEIEVSIDEQDISVVSFLNPLDGRWHDAFAAVAGLEGVSLREWMDTVDYCSRLFETAQATSHSVGQALKQFRDAA